MCIITDEVSDTQSEASSADHPTAAATYYGTQSEASSADHATGRSRKSVPQHTRLDI